MFAGIIQNKARLKSIQMHRGEAHLTFTFQQPEKKVQKGESIAVNGVCLTAVKISRFGFEADLLPETLNATNLGQLVPGSWVNLERSLKAGDAIGGHFVTGHVDAVGKIIEIKKRGGNWSLLVQAPASIISNLAVKGSVACDGISLTIQALMQKSFRVAIIPHTLIATTLGLKKIGDGLNLEVDMLMRYLARLQSHSKPKGLSVARLKQEGF